jgi:hypothetical protein
MYYFAYASNLNRKQMQERCPDSKPMFTAVLPNHKVVFTSWSRQWRGGVAAVKSAKGERVPGAIYEVTEKCLRRLDKYEAGYRRFNVMVYDEDGGPVEAVTFIKAGQLEETAPSKEYVALIQQGYKDWEIE